MARTKKPNDCGTGIPYHEVEALARVLLRRYRRFLRVRKGSWNLLSGKRNSRPNKRTKHNKGGNICNDAPALLRSKQNFKAKST